MGVLGRRHDHRGCAMTVHKFPEEPLPENKSLLNRQSKNALKQLKEAADPHYLYSLQLADAVLQKGLYQPRGPELEQTVHGMYGWKPKDAQRYLEQNTQGDPIELFPSTPGKPPNPEDLAAAILGEIEHKLSLPSASGYPTIHPRYLRE